MKATRRTALKLIAGTAAALSMRPTALAEENTTSSNWPRDETKPYSEFHWSKRFSTAGFFAVSESPRKVFNFNLGWRFIKADIPGAQAPDFSDENWEAASLPHGLEILPENASGGSNYQGPAWYRKQFTVSASSDIRTFLYFEAVMGKCIVWVNGTKVAEHFGGYLPFAADVTAVLRHDNSPNVVAVRADNSDDPTYPPGKPQHDLDFTYMGGIYRDAFLIQAGSVYVTFPEISSTVAGGGVLVGIKDITGKDADIEVRTEIVNSRPESSSCILSTTLEDSEGREILRQQKKVMLSPGGSCEVIQLLSPKHVHLWTPNDPYLHFIRTDVIHDGKIVDSLRTRFGIRLFQMHVQDGLFINKKQIGYKLSGVNRHQDYVYVGNALPKSGQWRDAKLLREGGSTVVRAAHEPMSPAFLDACDELGLLVTEANPGWQFYNAQDPLFKERLIDDTRQMVRRDRNRPSILLWETAINETPDQPIEVVHQLHLTAHAEDPFPGVFTVADSDIARAAGLDVYYYASASDQVNTFTREYGDGGEVDNFYSQNAQARVDREWGELAMLTQLRIRADGLDGVFGTPEKQIGAALWAGIDHQRGYHPDPFWGGLVDIFRLPRYSYHLFKSQYDADLQVPGIETGPMVYLTNELTQISGQDVVVLTNCDEVRLSWMGQVIATQKPDAQYKHVPHPPITFKDVFDFHRMKRELDRSRQWSTQMPPQMVAEGIIDGKVVTKQVRSYAGRTTAVKLELDNWGMPLIADGSDFTPLRVNIVDQNGTLKVLAPGYVFFTIEGPGEIIGGEFNQANPMRAEFGTATALIRSTTTPGKIKVKAYVNGLKADEIIIESLPTKMIPIYDRVYAEKSRRASGRSPEIKLSSISGLSTDMQKLQDQVRELQLQVTNKEQELMDMKNKCSPQ